MKLSAPSVWWKYFCCTTVPLRVGLCSGLNFIQSLSIPYDCAAGGHRINRLLPGCSYTPKKAILERWSSKYLRAEARSFSFCPSVVNLLCVHGLINLPVFRACWGVNTTYRDKPFIFALKFFVQCILCMLEGSPVSSLSSSSSLFP